MVSEYIVKEIVYPDAIKQEVVGKLIRCKDCKHNPNYTATDDACPFIDTDGYVKKFPEDDGFCKWGEKR